LETLSSKLRFQYAKLEAELRGGEPFQAELGTRVLSVPPICVAIPDFVLRFTIRFKNHVLEKLQTANNRLDGM
jgi:hypothetical protein